MATLTVPIQRARGYLRAAQSDSLVRNSLFIMATTVVTAGLGGLFWIVTAHTFTSAQVGVASAVISLCSTVSLLTYLGAQAMLIESLHAFEGSRKWMAVLVRISVTTAVVTAAAAAVTIPLFAHDKSYGFFFSARGALLIAIFGSAIWTLANLFTSVFVAARQASGMLTVQGLISVIKVLLLVPVSAIGLGAAGIVVAWVGSAFIGVVVTVLWFLPRLGLGVRHGGSTNHRAVGMRRRRTHGATGYPRHVYRGARRRRSSSSRSHYARRLIGQHLTSVGGAVTPLILPILVVLRLGATQNAYFYITWMLGSIFFMVSPAISNALFAESVRIRSNLRVVVNKAIRVTSLLLIPAIVIMIGCGRLILGVFGQPYVVAGYGLLIVLAVSAIPDAVSNIAVSIFRVTDRLVYCASLNVGIMIATFFFSWFLMPWLGIAGAGAGWLAAQVIGAIASIPAYINMDRRPKPWANQWHLHVRRLGGDSRPTGVIR